MRPPCAMARGVVRETESVSRMSHGDLRFLGSRTSLGGYTHDPTHVTHGYDPIRRLMGVDYVIRGHRVAVSDMWGRRLQGSRMWAPRAWFG